MKKIPRNFIIPSAGFVLRKSQIQYFSPMKIKPVIGDVIYGEIIRIGEHSSIENASGRIHMLHNGKKGIFVFGNRYAPDYYEGFVPQEHVLEVDLLSRSGMVGEVGTKKESIKDATRIKVLGYVTSKNGEILNTTDFPKIVPKQTEKKFPRSKLILVCGTTMNSGKSTAAASICRTLSSADFNVRACKVTGTASLKDILLFNDSGANRYADFSYLGYPSTYKLSLENLNSIFNGMDLKFGNNPRNYWVVELADGIIQRETALLLKSNDVVSRIHKLIFCANDAFGAIGGLRLLQEEFRMSPNAISGVCSSSPLHIRELSQYTDIPIINSIHPNSNQLMSILTSKSKRSKNILV